MTTVHFTKLLPFNKYKELLFIITYSTKFTKITSFCFKNCVVYDGITMLYFYRPTSKKTIHDNRSTSTLLYDKIIYSDLDIAHHMFLQ